MSVGSQLVFCLLCFTDVYQTSTTYWLALILCEPLEACPNLEIHISASVPTVEHTEIKGESFTISVCFEESVNIESAEKKKSFPSGMLFI